ncbi:MAG: hypothetical protein IT578_06215 [Verrucomicrobiae bacterium]|nr:hypothetical protein [Verrucomicrobiae bacterium]
MPLRVRQTIRRPEDALLRRIGISLPEGLPHKEYALCDGPVSVVLDASGGINLVEYQGPRRMDGPRRGAFYSNGIWRREAFFSEPVLTFALEAKGRPQDVGFKNLFLMPFGVVSRASADSLTFERSIWIRGNAVLFEWKASAPARVAFEVREGFLAHHNEDDAAWETPAFDERIHALRYGLLRRFQDGFASKVGPRERHEACSWIGSFAPAVHESDGVVRRLQVEFGPGAPARFAMVFGEDTHETEWRLRDAWASWTAWFQEQTARYAKLAEATPRLEVEGAPPALAEMMRVAPLFQESMRCVRHETQVGLRAATRGYGMWNGWDGEWPAMVLNACGSDDTVPRYLNFLDAVRGPNGAIPMTVGYDFGPVYGRNFRAPDPDRPLGDGYQINHEMWGISLLHQVFFRSGDRAVLERFYPGFAKSLRVICSHASRFGLVGSCFGGADRPEQCARPSFEDPRENNTLTSRLCGVEDMAALFSGLIQGAELAAVLDDRATVRACARVVDRLEKHFLRLYFDEHEKFLVDSVWFKDDPSHRNPFLRLTSLLAFQGYGEQLLLDVVEPLAECARTRFRHPALGLAVAPRDRREEPVYERWKDNWVQNQTRETLKLARLAGDQELLDLQVNAFLKHYAADRLIHENLFHASPGGRYKPESLYQATSWWQGMTLYAWWMGFLDAVAGIRFERGPLECVPGDGGRDVALTNLHWNGHRWAVRVRGRGRWIASMKVNGQARVGTHQIQPCGPAFDQKVTILKTDRPPNHPVILSAGACAVRETKATPGRLRAVLDSSGFARLHLWSPTRPILKVNGRRVNLRWSARRSEATSTLLLEGRLRLDLA